MRNTATVHRSDVSHEAVHQLRKELHVVQKFLVTRQCRHDNNKEREFVESCLMLLDYADATTDRPLAGLNYEIVKKQTAHLIASTNGMLLDYVRRTKMETPYTSHFGNQPFYA